MGDHIISSLVTIATAITGIALLAVLVSNQANTSSVIQAGTSGFATDIEAAVSPVTGGSGLSSMSGFTGGAGTISPLM